MKRLSVIIPGHNNKRAFWRRCVQSVERMTGCNDEIILVDDGSSDGSGSFLDEIAHELAGKADVRVLHKPNGGLSSARNEGLDVAQGEYVAFVDSDDEVKGDVFDCCIGKLEECRSDVCIYGYRTIWVSCRLQKRDVPVVKAPGTLSRDDIFELYGQNLLNPAWNKVYRRSFLGDLRFDLQGMPCEDIIFNLECVRRNARFCYIDVEGYAYYRVDGTLLTRYCPTSEYALGRQRDAWMEICGFSPISDGDIRKTLWKNIWMRDSPYSYGDRWRWLCANSRKGIVLEYVKTALFVFARRWLYGKPIRRWHVKRLFPKAAGWRDIRS